MDVVRSTPQELVQNRTHEQLADFPLPPIKEAVVEVLPSTPQERVQNRTPEQIVDVLVPQIVEDRAALHAGATRASDHRTHAGADRGCPCASGGVRTKSYSGADHVCACASGFGGRRGGFCSTRVRAESYSIAGRGCASAPVQTGQLAARTTEARAKSYSGADRR